MATDMKCTKCGSEEIDYDPARGDAACVACGTVVQQSLIVNEVTFAEDGRGRSNMVGQHVGADGQAMQSVLPGHTRQATFNTMMNAKRQMNQLASQLRLSSGHVEQAVRLYRLAVERNFHKGRRVLNLSCACLYVVCRLERTPHMLLDFSDVAQTNVFALGYTFLKLVRLLQISLPLIDPSLYMHRFAARLEFGESQNGVAMTALRIAARMQRDWMTHGRRPAGLCGAALITAAFMHGFYRSQTEVARIVRIGNVVLRNRLRELDKTPTASMTAKEIDAGGGDDGKKGSLLSFSVSAECDPPAFTRLQALKAARLGASIPTISQKGREDAKACKLDNASNQENEAEKRASDNADTGQASGYRQLNEEEIVNMKKRLEDERAKRMAADERVHKLMADAMASKEMQALDNESNIALNLDRSEKILGKSTAKSAEEQGETHSATIEEREGVNDSQNWAPDEEAADLSDLDDEDAAKYISTEEEYKQKEVLWTETNKDYLEKQARMEMMKRERPEEYNRLRPGRGQKKRKSGESDNRQNRNENAKTNVANNSSAAPPKPKPSKKLNYSVLQSLEEGDDMNEIDNIETG